MPNNYHFLDAFNNYLNLANHYSPAVQNLFSKNVVCHMLGIDKLARKAPLLFPNEGDPQKNNRVKPNYPVSLYSNRGSLANYKLDRNRYIISHDTGIETSNNLRTDILSYNVASTDIGYDKTRAYLTNKYSIGVPIARYEDSISFNDEDMYNLQAGYKATQDLYQLKSVMDEYIAKKYTAHVLKICTEFYTGYNQTNFRANFDTPKAIGSFGLSDWIDDESNLYGVNRSASNAQAITFRGNVIHGGSQVSVQWIIDLLDDGKPKGGGKAGNVEPVREKVSGNYVMIIADYKAFNKLRNEQLAKHDVLQYNKTVSSHPETVTGGFHNRKFEIDAGRITVVHDPLLKSLSNNGRSLAKDAYLLSIDDLGLLSRPDDLFNISKLSNLSKLYPGHNFDELSAGKISSQLAFILHDPKLHIKILNFGA